MPFAVQPLPLPSTEVVETPEILRQAAKAHRRLAELKGAAKTFPNEGILIDTLALREAKDSSAIENIVTTEEEVFRGEEEVDRFARPASKEVHDYAAALKAGFGRLREQGFIRLQDILMVQETLERNKGGGSASFPVRS